MKTDEDTKPSMRLTKSQLLDHLVEGLQTETDLFGPEGMFTKLKAAVMERLLTAELEEHLASGSSETNSRNGYSEKTVQTESGPVDIRVPRDREGTFEPRLVPKYQRRLDGFDDKVIALYARGMTVRDIQRHLEELYGTAVSADLISRATEGVREELLAWQKRPLQSVYPIVYLDALFVPVRDRGVVQKRAFYIALGMQMDGTRDVLGIWVAPTEGAKFWLGVLNELKGRGVEDIFFVCSDGLNGFTQAIEAAFPRAVHQTCVVHLLRAALRYVPWKNKKDVAAALRTVYTAADEQAADQALSEVERKYDDAFPRVARVFREHWAQFVPFLSYPQDIRRILYTTNVIESLNSQLRKSLRNRGPFPNDDAALKTMFLAIRYAKVNWKRPLTWAKTLAQLDIMFEERLPR